MRIVHVTGHTVPKYGAFERYMVALAEECRRRGHRFHCIWERVDPPDRVGDDLRARGAESLVLPARRRTGRFWWRLLRWLEAHPTAVLHTHFGPACYAGIAAAVQRGVPVLVHSIHSGLTAIQQARALPPVSRVLATLRTSLPCRVFAVSQGVRRGYAALGIRNTKFRVRYIGVPLGAAERARQAVRQEFGLRRDDIVVACIAFHGPIKGVDVLLRALAEMAGRCPALRVLQIGGESRPGETAELQALAAELGVSQRVIWAGLRNDVPDLLAACDIYCQPSRAEGLGLAILEAMAAGLPVAATSVGGIPEAVVDEGTGLLVPPEDPPALASALQRLGDDAALRRSLGQAGRERVRENFDLRVQTARLVDDYEYCLDTMAG